MTGAETTATEPAPAPGEPAGSRAEAIPPLVLVGLGGYLLAATPDIRAAPGEGLLGPRFFPYLVGGLLLAVGAVLFGQVVVSGVRQGGRAAADSANGSDEGGEDVDTSRGLDLRTVALLVAVLLAHVGLVERAGWPIAAGVLFGGSALVLGARRPLPLLACSVAVPAVAYLVFTRGLGVALPAGPFAGLG
jgi:putative tricarboxylic transport membrane protein